MEGEKDEPHLIDGGSESQTEGLACDRQACFETRSAEREIGFDFVSVVARGKQSSGAAQEEIKEECMGYVLHLFQDVGDRYQDTRDGVPAQHSHDGNYDKGTSAHIAECMRRWTYCTVLESRMGPQPLHIENR